MRTTNWISVKPDDVGQQSRTEGGAQMFKSPYDFPRQFRADYSPDTGNLVLRFHYLEHEGTRSKVLGAGATAEIGRNSGRIFMISLDCTNLDDSFRERIHRVFEELPRVVDSSMIAEDNYRVARRVVDANDEKLMIACANG